MTLIERVESIFNSRNQRGNSMGEYSSRNSIEIKTNTAEDIFDVYKNYPTIFGIVNDIRDAIRNTPIWISEPSGVEMKAANAMEFKRLNKRPNIYSNTNLASDIAFELVCYGRCFLYRKRGTMQTQFFLIKNVDVDSVKYKDAPYSEKQIEYIRYKKKSNNGIIADEIKNINGNLIELTYSESNYENRFNTDMQYDFISPLAAAARQVEAHANMTDALNEGFADGGARKIISFKNGDGSYSYSKTILPEEDAELQEKLKSYGRNKLARKYIVTKQEVSTADLSLPINQLDVQGSKPALESAICNAFRYPPQLLAIKTGAYKSQTEAERAFYVRCVAPLANYIFEQLDILFETNINGKIELDYSELTFFQEDKQKKGAAIQTFMQGAVQALEKEVMTKEQVIKEIKNML